MTMGLDWTTAYDNRAAVAGASEMATRWSEQAAAFRKARPWRALAYGPHPRQMLDLFEPLGQSVGLAVFVHGGYWHRNDQQMFSHLAAGPLERGWSVALPGYPLCPEVGVSEITRAVAGAVDAASTEVEGPVRLAGHSAGGHLVSRLMCDDAGGHGFRSRLERVLSISGLHDLRPLRRTPMQAVLALSLEEARAESPALLEPLPGVPFVAWVGAKELPELRRQSGLIANVWTGLATSTRLIEEAGHDHFTVIEALADAASPLVDAWLGA